MDRMLAGVDGPAMLEGWIFGGIVTQHVELQHCPGLKVSAGGEDLDLDRHDFIGPHRLALPMGVPGASRSASLDVLGHDAAKYPAFKHGRTVNAGEHSIHAGGRYPAMLLTPFSRGGWMPTRSALGGA